MRGSTLIICLFILIALNSQVEARQFTSPWLRGQKIPKRCQKIIWQRVDKYERLGEKINLNRAMRKMKAQMRYVNDSTAKYGVCRWQQTGTTLAESKGNPDQVDGVFMAGHSNEAHCGGPQFNCNRLPKSQRDDLERIKCAKLYQKTHDPKYLKRWKQLDVRFDPKWSQNQLALESASHQISIGHSSFNPICHNACEVAVKIALQKYFKEKYGLTVQRSEISYYVRKYDVTFWDVYLQKGKAYRYLMACGESLGERTFSDAAWSELFARFCKRNNIKIGNSIQVCARSSEKNIQKKQSKNTPVMAKTEGVNTVENLAGVISFVKDSVFQLLRDSLTQIESSGILIGKWLIVLTLIVSVFIGLRHILPFLFFAFIATLKWIWGIMPRVFIFGWKVTVALFGSKKSRKNAWLELIPSKK